MNKSLLRTACFMGLVVSQTAGAATISGSISGSVGGAPLGVTYVNFDDLIANATGLLLTTASDSSIVTVNISPSAQTAQGSQDGVYAAPFLSGGNGNNFGDPSGNQANGVDETVYLTSGSTVDNGSVTLTFSSSQRYLGLLWGSVDPGNTLEFFNGAVSLGTVLGSDVTGSPNGDQGVNGTLYVNINLDLPFTSVTATSPSNAFEFDNVAFNARPVGVPDGGTTLSLLGLALAGTAAVSRRLKSK